jgi:hypothetical protein
MADVTLIKRWKVTEVLLKRAHKALPSPEHEEKEHFHALEKEFFDFLDHNEHELALDMLQELGDMLQPRGGFWKDLVRASENMELSNRVPYFDKKYDDALSLLKETNPS